MEETGLNIATEMIPIQAAVRAIGNNIAQIEVPLFKMATNSPDLIKLRKKNNALRKHTRGRISKRRYGSLKEINARNNEDSKAVDLKRLNVSNTLDISKAEAIMDKPNPK